MKETLSASARVTAAWVAMADNKLVEVYQAMDLQQVTNMIKSGTMVLPEGQEPIAAYLRAVRDYAQPSPKS